MRLECDVQQFNASGDGFRELIETALEEFTLLDRIVLECMWKKSTHNNSTGFISAPS